MSGVERLSYLDALRGFAIALVVGIHAHGYAFTQAETPPQMNRLFADLLGIAVPVFYLVDGWLTVRSQSARRASARETIVRSARRLLVPWLIFNVLYVGFRAFAEWRGLVPDRLLVGRPLPAALDEIWRSRIASQLYFLPTLFLMRVAATAIRPILLGPIGGLVLFWLGYVAAMRATGASLTGDPATQAFIEFPFFLFGAVVRRLETADDPLGFRILIGVGAVAVASRLAPLPDAWARASFEAGKYGLVLFAYLIARRAGDERLALPLVALGRMTMQIYLIHSPVLIKIVQMICSKFVGPNWGRYAAVWAATLAASVVLTLILDRIPASRKLFGGG